MSESKKHLTIPLKIAISLVLICRVIIVLKIYQYLDLDRTNATFWINGLQSLSIILIFVLYPIRFYRKHEKFLEDFLKVLVVEFYALFSISNLYHLPQATILSYLAIGSFLSWIFLGLINSMKIKKEDEKTAFMAFPTYLGIFSITVFGIGILLKIQHLPFGNMTIMMGTILLIVWIFEAEWRSQWRK